MNLHGLHPLQLIALHMAMASDGYTAGGATDLRTGGTSGPPPAAAEPPSTPYPGPYGDSVPPMPAADACDGCFDLPKTAAANLIKSLVALGLDDIRITVTGSDGREYSVGVYAEKEPCGMKAA